MKSIKMVLLLTCVFVFYLGMNLTVFSQPGDPDDPDVPITGIEWLLVGGSLFGARKIYQKFRNRP